MKQVATTLICLFHDRDDAESVREDLVEANVPEGSITLIHRDGSHPDAISGLSDLDLPSHDLHHLLNGLEHGDTVLTVDTDAHLAERVEAIFRAHEADPVSESDSGQRSIETHGMRGFNRSGEIPFTQEVKLRDQSGQVERRPVGPGASPAASQQSSIAGEQVIELTETREELVITKAARVIEEVIIGRETADRIQHVEETLRYTEIEVQHTSPGDGEVKGSRR